MNINQQNNIYLQKVSSKLVRILSNLKFAIFILLIIAGFSVFGTIIEQNQSTDFYKQNYPENKAVFGLLNWEVIKFFNLDDVYRSWWYLSLLIILGLSLVTCSFTQQLPMLKIAKNWKFLKRTQQLRNVDLKVKLKRIDSSDIIYQLSQETYNTFQQENCFYCYKGIIGRIAPIFVHVSIIQIFIGALFGAFFGYGGQEMIPKNETFHLQNIINAGYFSKTPISTNLRINNFWIDYINKEDGVINQFYSDISLLNNKGEEIRRKIISVNNPLHYKDLTLYQSDWDILGIRGRLMNKQRELQYQVKKIKTTNGNRWLSQIKTGEGIEYNRNILIKELKKEVSLYDEKGEYLKKIEEGESFDLKGQQFILDEILPATGIDVKSDPGIPFVYFGFVLLIISTLLSFVSYSRIWVFSIENNLYIGGKSNRAKIAFERYFLKQLSKLKRLS
jgi:cytochrome c biogenesis protein